MSQSLDRGWLLFLAKRYDLARDATLEHLKQYPDDAPGVALLARCEWLRGVGDEAITLARRAVGLCPTNLFAIESLARILVDANHYDESRATLESGLRLAPSATLFGLKSWVECCAGNFAASIADADRGLALDATSISCLESRAWSEFKSGAVAAARASCETILRIDPESAYAHRVLGWIAVGARQSDEARKRFVESLRIEPTSEQSRRGLVTAMKSRSRWSRTWTRIAELHRKWRGLIPVAVVLVAVFNGYLNESKAMHLAPPLRATLQGVIVLALFLVCFAHVFAPGLALVPMLCDPLGRRLLSDESRMAAWCSLVGILSIVVGEAVLLIALWPPELLAIAVAIFFFPMFAGIASARIPSAKSRRVHTVFVALITAVALAVYSAAFVPGLFSIDVLVVLIAVTLNGAYLIMRSAKSARTTGA